MLFSGTFFTFARLTFAATTAVGMARTVEDNICVWTAQVVIYLASFFSPELKQSKIRDRHILGSIPTMNIRTEEQEE